MKADGAKCADRRNLGESRAAGPGQFPPPHDFDISLLTKTPQISLDAPKLSRIYFLLLSVSVCPLPPSVRASGCCTLILPAPLSAARLFHQDPAVATTTSGPSCGQLGRNEVRIMLRIPDPGTPGLTIPRLFGPPVQSSIGQSRHAGAAGTVVTEAPRLFAPLYRNCICA